MVHTSVVYLNISKTKSVDVHNKPTTQLYPVTMTIDVTDAVGMGLEPDDADLGDRWRCHLDHVRHEPRSHVHAAVSTHPTPSLFI